MRGEWFDGASLEKSPFSIFETGFLDLGCMAENAYSGVFGRSASLHLQHQSSLGNSCGASLVLIEH